MHRLSSESSFRIFHSSFIPLFLSRWLRYDISRFSKAMLENLFRKSILISRDYYPFISKPLGQTIRGNQRSSHLPNKKKIILQEGAKDNQRYVERYTFQSLSANFWPIRSPISPPILRTNPPEFHPKENLSIIYPRLYNPSPRYPGAKIQKHNTHYRDAFPMPIHRIPYTSSILPPPPPPPPLQEEGRFVAPRSRVRAYLCVGGDQ